MAFRIQIRRDTASKWSVNNPILLEGELGYTTDTKLMKVGDGTTEWNDLDYWNGSAYSSYVALLTQTGTNAPVATILENGIGDLIWTRSATGSYRAGLTGAFTSGKTALFTSNTANTVKGDVYIYPTGDQNSISIQTCAAGVTADGVLGSTAVEIRVYL
jgi:hypothetical protein